jgi:hypothetical protein
MTKLLMLSLVVVALLGIGRPLQGQSESKPTIRLVGGPRTLPQIYVHLDLQASNEPLYIPYCGEYEGGVRMLCTVGTHLQVRSRQGWQSVKPRTTFAVLGAAMLDRSKGKLIDPHSSAEFTLQFSRRYYLVEPGQEMRVLVEPGQEMRVLVDAWTDEQSMKAGASPIQLTSPPFECPQAGFGN